MSIVTIRLFNYSFWYKLLFFRNFEILVFNAFLSKTENMEVFLQALTISFKTK